MEGWWLTALGFVAGTCTTFSFVPQLLKAWHSTDTEAISKRTYLISTAAFALDRTRRHDRALADHRLQRPEPRP